MSFLVSGFSAASYLNEHAREANKWRSHVYTFYLWATSSINCNAAKLVFKSAKFKIYNGSLVILMLNV